jgi:hypothetical protein
MPGDEALLDALCVDAALAGTVFAFPMAADAFDAVVDVDVLADAGATAPLASTAGGTAGVCV